MRIALGALFLMAMVGCGGNSGTGGGGGDDMAGGGSGGCTATMSGAATASYSDCQAVASWDGSKNQSLVSIVPKDASGSDAGPVSSIVLGGMLSTGTFKSSDAGANGAIHFVDTTSATVSQWAAAVGTSAGSGGAQGSYSLTITSTNPFAMATSVIDYEPHGSLTATLAPIAGTGATGNIDYTINF